jgi:membrane-associated protease RseP (regulator of RpoE activity)
VEITSIIENNVLNYFNIKSVHIGEKELYFVVYDYSRDRYLQLVEDLDKIGYLPFIEEYEDDYKIKIVTKPKKGESRIHLNIFLFIITIVTTISAGYLFEGSIIDGIAFAIAIMAIIGTHETAHYFAAKKHGVKATLPYFIPAPTLIGTFGAVINIKSAIPTKNALFDLGVSGPIAGFLVTIPVLIIGFSLSHVAPLQPGTMSFYPPLLMQIIMNFTSPQVPPGYDLYMHPVAFAGWVGIIVTMLNLMPVAVLDGGHISRSIFKEKIHYYVSIAGIIVTVILGWYVMAALMAVFLLFVTKRHPGALDNVSKINKNRKIVAVLVFIIFILCLSPMPFITV